jgi:hypothetical protein
MRTPPAADEPERGATLANITDPEDRINALAHASFATHGSPTGAAALALLGCRSARSKFVSDENQSAWGVFRSMRKTFMALEPITHDAELRRLWYSSTTPKWVHRGDERNTEFDVDAERLAVWPDPLQRRRIVMTTWLDNAYSWKSRGRLLMVGKEIRRKQGEAAEDMPLGVIGQVESVNIPDIVVFEAFPEVGSRGPRATHAAMRGRILTACWTPRMGRCAEYALEAAVLGRNNGDGCYFTAARRGEDGIWWTYDDENVYKVPEGEVTGAEPNAEGLRPVLHFYEREDERTSRQLGKTLES